MLSYYTVLIMLSWMALGVLCILVRESSWIPQSDKRHFYLTYGIIALSALAEWAGIQLNGNMALPKWVLAMVNCFDYVLTPMAGGAVVAQIRLRDRWSKALTGLLTFNAVFQVVSCFTGWMIVIDENHHYSHGPLYMIYVAVYLAVIVLVGAEFLVYGKSYRQQNRCSLYSVLLLVIVGVGLQELLGGEYRTAYIVVTIGVTMMFIHYTEFYQMTADDYIRQQRNQLMKDALTGAFSRHAYMNSLEKYRNTTSLPEDLAAFTLDINGLKNVNDTIGHDAGDELIVGAARCIERAFGAENACFRTGGDEFVVLGRMTRSQADAALEQLERETGAWSGSAVKRLSLSAGYALACDHQGLTVEELMKKADQAMYSAKAEYYRKDGNDRRTR